MPAERNTAMTEPIQDPTAFPAPPASAEAERSVIGAALQDSAVLPLLADSLTPEDFFGPEHQAIFTAILGLYAAGKPVDLMTLGNALAEAGTLDAVGGAAYLLDCFRFVPSTANTKTYVDIVREKSALRKLIRTASEIRERCFRQTDAPEDILSSAEALLSACVGGGGRQESAASIRDVVSASFDQIERFSALQGRIAGTPTGFYDLDRMLTGLHPGELIIVGGRPAMGKTSFGIAAAAFAASAGKNVCFYSLEMPSAQIGLRLVSLCSGVSMQNIRRGNVQESDWVAIGDAANTLSESSMTIDDTSALSPAQMRSRLKRAMAKAPVDLVVVDYLGLMSCDTRTENRQNEVSTISRQLKALAKDLQIPVMVLAQLNRANTARGDKKPSLADLRDSGSIEQDADVVLFVHREGYYDPSADQYSGEIIIAKQRNGPVGSVKVKWNPETASYSNAPDAIRATYV